MKSVKLKLEHCLENVVRLLVLRHIFGQPNLQARTQCRPVSAEKLRHHGLEKCGSPLTIDFQIKEK